MEETPALWEATYEAKTAGELCEAYRQWACDYDHDTLDVMGYVAPNAAAAMLDYHVDSKTCRVLDAGCGTGLVGEALSRMGYTNVDALDFSEDMLNEADKKSVYRECFQDDMNGELALPDDAYDAAICVGTFTYAHVGPHAFEELIRVTRPGGHICFTIRDGAYQEYDYRSKMLALEAEDAWQLQEMREAEYLVKEKVKAIFCTYRVLPS